MDYNSNTTDTDWDLSAFITTQKSSKYASNMPRPIVDTMFQRDDELNSFTDQNGMDIFTTPPFARGQDEQFCTRANIDSRLRFLNQEFLALGFQTLFPRNVVAGREAEARFDLSHLINGTYELLKSQKQQIRARDDLEAKQIRSESDNEALIQSQNRLKEELEAAKREICVTQMREKRLADQFKLLQNERKMEREDMKKMKSDMQHKQKQYIHESKRKEKEMLKLKERLNQLLTDKSHEKRLGMEIINSIQRTDGKRKLWKAGGKQEEEMYRLIISNYEEKHKELTMEIGLLREYLADVQRELVSLVNEKKDENDDEFDDKFSDANIPTIANGHFHMPFHVVGEDVKNHFRMTWQQLKEKIEGSSKGSSPVENESQTESAASVKKIANMKEQIENYQAIISKQEQLLQSMQDGDMLERIETYLKGDETHRETEKRIKSEREKLLSERKLMTELALKLAEEREEFERERMEFYKHCISTPVIQKESADNRMDESRPRANFTKVVPTFSPAPKTSTKDSSTKQDSACATNTPTTNELYRYMSLAIHDDENDELNGSYLEDKNENEADSGKENDFTSLNSGSDGRCIRKDRVAEHKENVRRLMEKFPRRGLEELTAI